MPLIDRFNGSGLSNDWFVNFNQHLPFLDEFGTFQVQRLANPRSLATFERILIHKDEESIPIVFSPFPGPPCFFTGTH